MRSWRVTVSRAYGAASTLWFNTCVVLLAANLVAWVAHRRHEGQAGTLAMLFNRRVLAQTYPALRPDEIDVLLSESVRDLIYEPYTEFTVRPIRGRFVTVAHEGYRWSTNQGPWPPDPRFFNVFLFGGSTLFGVGVTDADTVASYLQPLLPPVGGRDVRVYNFGRSGYYSTQERILLEKLLVQGVVPDAAVFVDGLNDFRTPQDVSLMSPQLAALVENASVSPWSAAVRSTALGGTAAHVGRLLGVGAAPSGGGEQPDAVAANADLAIDHYLRNKRNVEGVAAAYGFRVAFVWQPVPAYRFPPADAGRWLLGGLNEFAKVGYPRMAERIATTAPGDDFLWCADVGADGTELFYVDPVHYAPVMAERVAHCIADGLRERKLLLPIPQPDGAR